MEEHNESVWFIRTVRIRISSQHGDRRVAAVPLARRRDDDLHLQLLLLDEKLEQVRQMLHERYRQGFAPLLGEAQERRVREATKTKALLGAVKQEEAELAAMRRELGHGGACRPRRHA